MRQQGFAGASWTSSQELIVEVLGLFVSWLLLNIKLYEHNKVNYTYVYGGREREVSARAVSTSFWFCFFVES